MFGVFFVSPKGNGLRSTAFLPMTNFRWEEGLFGPIEAATEFDAASYFARSPRRIALARNNTKHGSDLLLTSKRSTCTCLYLERGYRCVPHETVGSRNLPPSLVSIASAISSRNKSA